MSVARPVLSETGFGTTEPPNTHIAFAADGADAATPFPLNETEADPSSESLFGILNCADRPASAPGVNRTRTCLLAPAAIVAPEGLFTIVKSSALEPLRDSVPNIRFAVPVFLIVKLRSPLAAPWVRSPKSIAVGDISISGAPATKDNALPNDVPTLFVAMAQK
jgi:hypothetical protein